MDLHEIHKRIELVLNKTTGQYLTHEELDDLLDMAQMQEFNLLIENSRELPQPRIGYGRTQSIHEDLLPFRNEVTIAGSIATLPENVEYITSIRKSGWQVDLLREDEVAARLGSVIISPTEDEPIAMLHSQTGRKKKVQLFPASVTEVKVHYLKRPDAPIFGYTTSGRSVVYSTNDSTQMEWNDRAIERIIQRALSLAGVNLADYNLANFSEQKQASGQ